VAFVAVFVAAFVPGLVPVVVCAYKERTNVTTAAATSTAARRLFMDELCFEFCFA
jgi:hypothetical protein